MLSPKMKCRWKEINEKLERLKCGSCSKSIRDDMNWRITICQGRIMSRDPWKWTHGIVWAEVKYRYNSVSLLHEPRSNRIKLLPMRRLSLAWWRNNWQNQSKISSFDSSVLCCEGESLTVQESRRAKVARRPLESNGCLKRCKEAQLCLFSGTIARWSSILRFWIEDQFDKSLWPLPWLPHNDRHQPRTSSPPKTPQWEHYNDVVWRSQSPIGTNEKQKWLQCSDESAEDAERGAGTDQLLYS